MNKVAFIILLIVVSATCVKRGAKPATDCTKHSEPWKLAQCASSLLQNKRITNTSFVQYLQKAISMIQSDGLLLTSNSNTDRACNDVGQKTVVGLA